MVYNLSSDNFKPLFFIVMEINSIEKEDELLQLVDKFLGLFLVSEFHCIAKSTFDKSGKEYPAKLNPVINHIIEEVTIFYDKIRTQAL